MLIAAALLLAQTAPQCTAMNAGLPDNLAAWAEPAGDKLTVGTVVAVDAVDSATLDALPAGSKAGPGAMVGFWVAKPGTYGVVLDQAAWIDVVPRMPVGEPLKSVKHGHGPDCSTIHKIVRFELKTGIYRIYLTGLTKPRARIMLIAD